jgi:hypothetical protein
MDATPTTTQRRFARLAGLMYLLVLAAAIFASFYVRASLIDWADAGQSAAAVSASLQLFRIGLASDLISFVGIVLLGFCLYRVLAPVNDGLAQLALLWWLGEAFILAAITLNDFIVLTLVGDGAYLAAFEPEQIDALAMVFLQAHLTGYNIGLVFFGFGSVVFSFLLLRSRYVPAPIAVFGVLAPAALLVGTFIILIVPQYESLAYSFANPPMALYELLIGAWLLIFGLRAPRSKRA